MTRRMPLLGWTIVDVMLFLVVQQMGPLAVVSLNETELDCSMRKLTLQYAQHVLSYGPRNFFTNHYTNNSRRQLWKEMHDALELERLCHVKFVTDEGEEFSGNHNVATHTSQERKLGDQELDSICQNKYCIFIDPHADQDSDSDGSLEHPFQSLHHAVATARASNSDPYETVLVLRDGTHTLNETLLLGPSDSGLSFIGYPYEDVWISGGIPIPNDIHWGWDCKRGLDIRVANLTDLLLHTNKQDLPQLVSVFTPNKRLIRARFPNGDPEVAQWGYRSPDKLKYSIPADQVLEWHRPAKGRAPNFELVDFRYPDSRNLPVKNDSTQVEYNMYASGHGGVCQDLWGADADSYWCSNSSSGGWAEVDRECAITGRLQIPVGMSYNQTSDIGERIKGWMAVGGIVHAWHSQTWAMHMFEIQKQDKGQFIFAPGGGKQGGRNWCRCDQCTYAAGWCGQHQDPPMSDDRLISGTWLVENILDELDTPGEFFFDRETSMLYLYPNTTDENGGGLKNLRFAVLESLIRIQGATDVSVTNLGFRDTVPTYMSDWSAPSGGDWSMHKGGALVVENSSKITIEKCIFRRLDGNAIFLSKRTRNVKIRGCVFDWLGENAIALWGETSGYDATKGRFPLGTFIEYNVMRELGLFQKQSSAIAHNKAAKTHIMNNVMFNMPRAAINFNDMVGGGDMVGRNAIFNTCRESGDHGPINTWDRQPYMTNIRDGTKSFVPLHRTIAFNFIIANYGAAQGVDNDDGSSWYHVRNNVFYDSEGFKMDYGGHDSIFEENLVVSYPGRVSSACIGFGRFYPGHGHSVTRNTCVVPNNGVQQPNIYLATCNQSNAVLSSNSYYTSDGKVSVKCGYSDADDSPLLSLQEAQALHGLEIGSTESKIPAQAKTVMSWAEKILFP